MPITLRGWKTIHLSPIMFLQVLRIVDQQVRLARKLDQSAIRPNIAFRIRCIYDGTSSPFHPIDINPARMSIGFLNADDQRIFPEFLVCLRKMDTLLIPDDGIRFPHRADIFGGSHLTQTHREGGWRLVIIQHSFQCLRRHARAENVETGIWQVSGYKEWKTLRVVVVQVTE